MADIKISGLSASTAITGDDLLVMVNDPGGGPVTYKITFDDFEESLAVSGMSDGTATGTGDLVRATSPTLVTPALGTPSALVGTNITGTAAGLTAGNVTTNANLTGPITSVGNATAVASQTGTGSTFVMQASPTLTTPNLGTPSTLVLTNATGLPVASGVSGLGAGIATFLATPSSANLASALTDETGSGAAVFATSPVLTTPNLGTPSALVGTNITGTAAGLTAGSVTGFTAGAGTLTGPASSGVALINGGALGTPSSGTLTNATGLPLAGVVDSTTEALGVGSLELGDASDTTLSRSSAGVLAVEGVVIPSISSTNTLTNKRITPRVTSEASSATPTINTDNSDAHSITALATAVTSMTTNLSGTPTDFQKLTIRFKDNGTARAITWGASFEAKGVTLPTTTVISKVLTVGFLWDSVTSKWGCVASIQEA